MRPSTSLKRQMILYFSLGFSVVFIAFGGAILQYNSNSFREQSYDYCRQIVTTRIALFDTYFMQLQNVSRIIVSDEDVIEAVTSRSDRKDIDYAKELYRQRNVVNKIKQIDVLGNIDTTMIIGSDGEYLYFYGRSPRKGYNFNHTEWFRNAVETEGRVAHFTGLHDTDYLLGDRAAQTVSMITPIINTAQFGMGNPAYLLCDFRLEPMITDEQKPGGIQVAIFEGETPIRFSNAELSSAQVQRLMRGLVADEPSFTLERDGQNHAPYIVVREQSDVSGWTILGIMPVSEIEAHRNANTLFVTLMILFSIGIIVLLSLLISNSILVPMRKLLARFNTIAGGNTAVDFETTGSVEINLLSDTATHMLSSIHRLQQEAIVRETMLAHEQFKVLQHQINPHLFNNTLQSIKALALSGDTAAISRTTTLLGRILSYCVYNPMDMVPLTEELQYIENYIALQQMRYPGISYGIDCSPQAGAFLVPKLIIQPIVENAIDHGLSGVQSGRIELCVEADDEGIHIMVIDSGVGFDVAKLEAIRAELEQDEPEEGSSHIGILNTHRRIRNLFGVGSGVSILSKPSMHTAVIITMVVKGGPRDAESHSGGR